MGRRENTDAALAEQVESLRRRIAELEETLAQQRGDHSRVDETAVTAAPKAEAALRESERLYRGLVETSQDLIWKCDGQGRFTFLNKAWEESHGYTIDEMLGRPFTYFQTPEVAARDKREFGRHLAGGGVSGYETTQRSKSGQELHLIFNAIPVLDDAGDVVGTQGTAVDITNRKRLEEQLAQGEKMRAIGTLAGGMAHDMNNVLAVVLGLGTVVEREMRPDDPLREDILEIVVAARRGKSLVENLLGFARKGKYSSEKVTLNDTVRSVVEMLRRSVSKKIVINTRLETELAQVSCDPAQIMQTLMNVSLNANDALDGSGTIDMSTANEVLAAGDASGLPPGQYVKVQIRDDGPGMNEETRKQAFEPFFTTKEVGKGTGLGLSMAYGVIDNHGGRISIDSSPDQGTNVIIVLPVAEEPSATGSIEAPQRAVLEGKGTVLLVDDEAMIRVAGKRMLESTGYSAIVADGGASAVEIFCRRRAEIDVVLLDLSMPEMDGVECFEKLKEVDPEVRVVICTGHGSADMTQQMVDHGALDVVRKPFDLVQLVAAIAAAMGQARVSPDSA